MMCRSAGGRWKLFAAVLGLAMQAPTSALATPLAQLQAAGPYVVGGPIVVRMTLSNPHTSGHPEVLEFGSEGNPLSLPDRTWHLVVLDPGGQELSVRANPATQAERIPNAGEDFFSLQPGDSVVVNYELSRHYTLTAPGIYVVEVTLADRRVVAQARFDLMELDVAQTQRVGGFCCSPWGNPDSPWAEVVGSLRIGRVKPEGKRDVWLAVLDSIKTFEAAWPPQFLSMVVPANTRVDKAALDYKWQLWMLLEAGGRRALFVWNIHTGALQVVQTWGAETIELSTAPAAINSRGRMVIAGVPGKTMETSSSIGSEGGIQPSFAPDAAH